MRPAYAVSLVACAIIALVVLIRPQPQQPPIRQTDWEMAAVCLWERWDQGEPMELTARKIRFCVTVDPLQNPR